MGHKGKREMRERGCAVIQLSTVTSAGPWKGCIRLNLVT